MSVFLINLSVLKNLRGKKAYNWGEIIYSPQSSLGPRLQKVYQLVVIHRGSAEIEIDGEWTRLGAGEALFLNPGQLALFRFSRREPTHHSWIHAWEPGGGDNWREFVPPPVRKLAVWKRLGTIMGELLEVKDPVPELAHQALLALAEAAFLEFFDRAGVSLDASPALHPGVGRALAILRSEFRERIDLPTLARKAGLSAQHLNRLFREQTGRTPIQELWRIRENEGLRLLLETGLTHGEIALACGFQNPFHFTRRMRQRFGRPPRDLRARHWRGEKA